MPDETRLLELLKSKAMLLLRRERELARLRREHDRTGAWFRAFQTLSSEVPAEQGATIPEGWTDRLAGELGFQVAAVFIHRPGCAHLALVHGLSPTALNPDPPIDEELLAYLAEQGSGRRNRAGSSTLLDRLAASLGLEKLLWLFSASEGARYLLVAGFLPEAARYQDDLSEEDLRSYALVAGHVHALMRNTNLISELWQRNLEYQARGDELATANLQLAASIKEGALTQAKLMAADRLASIGSLARGMAHEINNPLAFVSADLEYLAGKLADAASSSSADWPQLSEVVSEARQGTERIRRVVRDLLTFSRTGDDLREPVDLADVLDLALSMSMHELGHRARLVKEYQAIPKVIANQHQLAQVFVNLLVNAAQSIREGQAERNLVRVSTACVGTRVVVEIQDSGAGIPEQLRAQIFEPFFTTKPVGVGTGLGLSICHGIVKGFGGEIEVESEVGKGSTFRVLLPASPD
jgi:signal transduction histidine kinase